MEIFTILAALCILIILFVWVLPKYLVMIPPRHFALVERFGIYHRTLSGGSNIIWWPIESLKELQWSSPVKKISGTMGSLDNIQLDIQPLECSTVDKTSVTVDGTLFFSVKTPHVAVYECEDALNHLYQVATQAFRNIVASVEVSQLNGKDAMIGRSIVSYINDIVEKQGLSCKSIIIQNVQLDQTVTESNQTRYTLDTKLALQEKEHAFQLLEAKHAAELERIAIEASGLSPDQRIAMEMAKSMGKATTLVIRGGQLPYLQKQ